MAATWSWLSGLLMSIPDTSPMKTGWIWRMDRLIGRQLTSGRLDLTRECHDNRAPVGGSNAAVQARMNKGEGVMTKRWRTTQLRTLRSPVMAALVVAALIGVIAVGAL